MKDIGIPAERYLQVLYSVAVSFLKTLPNNTHTFIFDTTFYVVSMKKKTRTGVELIINPNPSALMDFLKEFVTFALQQLLISSDTESNAVSVTFNNHPFSYKVFLDDSKELLIVRDEENKKNSENL